MTTLDRLLRRIDTDSYIARVWEPPCPDIRPGGVPSEIAGWRRAAKSRQKPAKAKSDKERDK